MTCLQCRDRIMDALYGEEIEGSICYDFFKHLRECSECDEEYLSLLEVRDCLSQWEVPGAEHAPPTAASLPRWSIRSWLPGDPWMLLQRVAAALLIIVGAAAILEATGIWKTERLMVSEQQLIELVNDMIVVRQSEERRLIGQALMSFADELQAQQRQDTRAISDQLQSLERRYLDVLEENNLYLKTLSTR